VYISDNDKCFKNANVTFPDMGTLIHLLNVDYTILGKPQPDMIADIVYDKSTSVMIGDSNTDYNFSKAIGVDFIHIKPQTNTSESNARWLYNADKDCYEMDSLQMLYMQMQHI
jgi:phosphoglycolate phosphatase-like HAD superfamily hydrolase